MRRILLYISCICLALLSFLHVRAEQIDTLLHFNLADLQIDTVTAADGQTYTKLNYPGCENDDQLGAPALPIKFLTFKLPLNSKIINYEVNIGTAHSISIATPVLPIQHPKSFSVKATPFVSCKSDIYGSPKEYPESNAIIKGRASVLDTVFVYLTVYPVKYTPQDNTCKFHETIHVTLTYKTEKPLDTEASSGTKSINSINLPVYDYCVITTRQLKDAFRRLIGWKRMKGFNAGVVCVEDIMECSQITGDMVTSNPQYLLTDSAAKIRQYLRYAKTELANSPRSGDAPLMMYVLMGGNDQVVPIRYGTGDDNYSDESYHIPSDLYYSELDKNWNVDNDGYLGEPNEVNYGANVYIGRILCTTQKEIENYTDKLLRYEMNPGAGNYSYLKRALYVQADEAQRDSVGRSLARQYASIFPDSTVVQEVSSYDQQYPTYPKGNNVISTLRNHYGIASFNAHGTPYEIFVSTSVVNEYHTYSDSPFYAVTSERNARTVSRAESINSFPYLYNKYYPMIGSSVSCYSAPFDILTIFSYDTLRTFNEHRNLAQSFTLNANSGGPAWIGCTRMGIQGSSTLVQEQFFNYMQENPIGVALPLARAHCDTTWLHYVSLSTNIIGCPELRVWTDIPTHVSVNTNQNGDWSFYPSQGETIYVGRRRFDSEPENINIFPTHYSEIGESFPPDEGVLTIYGKNRLPTILPFELHDGYLTQSGYIFTKEATIGNGTSDESVEFESGSDYVFEIGGTFTLGKNVKINSGAKLLIKPTDINY